MKFEIKNTKSSESVTQITYTPQKSSFHSPFPFSAPHRQSLRMQLSPPPIKKNAKIIGAVSTLLLGRRHIRALPTQTVESIYIIFAQ